MRKNRKIKYLSAFLAFFALVFGSSTVLFGAKDQEVQDASPGRTMARQALKNNGYWSTVDHSKLKELQKTFSSGSEVTAACLSCHSEASKQFQETIHWTWLTSDGSNGNDLGKAGYSINNFCISTNKTEDFSCMSCHPGWGEKMEAINCLVCHSQKDMNLDEAFTDFQGFQEDGDEESLEIAEEIQSEIRATVQSISRPSRINCGTCHFYGGGGDGVKHGDLDTSLAKPNKTLDVHMGVDGQDFDCVRCHTTVRHNIAGRVYTKPAALHRKSLIEDDLTSKITCESCHTEVPHQKGSKANDHTDKVACQSCHIPTFARVNPTKLSWDWSEAGKKKDGKAYKTKDQFGKYDYMSIKGKMEWAKDVIPEYFWYNGSIESTTLKDRIDPANVVPVSRPLGDPKDRNSRIHPFKIHKSVQPYDVVNNTLLAPMLSGSEGYWSTLDWDVALKKGMKAMDELPFSGKYDFVETTYVFPITHMVAPKDNVVSCNECHIQQDGRLAKLVGFYMPGRDSFKPIYILGWLVVLGSFGGVLLHGLGRFISRKGK